MNTFLSKIDQGVFVWQKRLMGLFIRTSGLVRATVQIGLANIVTNIRLIVWLTQNNPPSHEKHK